MTLGSVKIEQVNGNRYLRSVVKSKGNIEDELNN